MDVTTVKYWPFLCSSVWNKLLILPIPEAYE